jgi:hypothetical protein
MQDFEQYIRDSELDKRMRGYA